SLARISGGKPSPKFAHIRSVSDRQVLLRLENNIKSRALGADDLDRAIDVLETMRLIAPGAFELVEELALLEIRANRLPQAREVLEAYKDAAGADREAAENLLRTIRNMLN
ncbi:MAG: hypothetical protein HQ503_14290, partial [Rhodospirillales bacterium]|nr:hypothetical protein [Rhodospirillales bacterium]